MRKATVLKQNALKTHRRYRYVMSVIFGVCFLFLSCQVALASHRCAVVFSKHDNSMLSIKMPLQAVMNKSGDLKQMTSQMLCQQHCSPDGSLIQLHDNLSVLAPLTSVTLTAVKAHDSQRALTSIYFSPPVVGPPKEISLCRFRE